MVRSRQNRDARMRELLTQECARIMAVEGVRDFSLAKRKAALRLGAPDTRNLPQNREIQDALLEYQRLFGGAARQATLRELRAAAVEAMEFFARFRPRLVGPVLDGTADDYSEVNLHLFADTPEEVVLFLMEHDIPFDTDERRFRFDDGYVFLPVHRFVAGEARMDVCVFSELGLRHPPRSRVDGRPMRRAAVAEVRALLDAE